MHHARCKHRPGTTPCLASSAKTVKTANTVKTAKTVKTVKKDKIVKAVKAVKAVTGGATYVQSRFLHFLHSNMSDDAPRFAAVMNICQGKINK